MDIFGTATENFKLAKLTSLMERKEFDNAKRYIQQYFIKIAEPVCVLMYFPTENRYAIMNYEEVKKGHLLKRFDTEECRLQSWFFNYTESFIITNRINSPKT